MHAVQSVAAAIGVAALVTTAPVAAGTFFRLEVGPAIAGGTGAKVRDFKKVVVVVRPRLCADPSTVRMTATAEGVVNGARQRVPIALVPIDAAEGVYAVHRQWPDGGHWVLHLSGFCPEPRASADTIVPLAKAGFIRERTQVLREPASRPEIETALAALVRSQS